MGNQDSGRCQTREGWGAPWAAGAAHCTQSAHRLPRSNPHGLVTDIKQAVEHLKPDATAIYVSAHQVTAAIEEAIEAEVPLIVAVAEHVPLHEMLRVGPVLHLSLCQNGASDMDTWGSRFIPSSKRSPSPAWSDQTRPASFLR